MINLPNLRQTFNYDCGATALQAVLAYYGVEVREDELMSQLGCSPEGTPINGLIEVAGKYGFRVEASLDTSIETVKQLVDEGFPVIILLQAWADRYMTVEDWKTENESGHYVVVIAHTGNVIVFEDPSSLHRTWLTEDELFARWHDVDDNGRELNRFAMVLKGKPPAGRMIKHMD